jgi:hypothetical protein
LLAGLSIGATFLVRPDGLLAVLGASLALGVLAVFATDAQRRSHFRGVVFAFHLGAAVSVGLTFIDFGRNSAVYEATSWTQLKPLTILVSLSSALVLAIVAAPSPTGLRKLLAQRRIRLSWLMAALVLLSFTLLALRPVFYTAHASTNTLAAAAIKARQAALGLPVDGSRTYDENTVTWLSWYYSWPVVILGGIGAAGLTLWVGQRRKAAYLPALGVLGVSSALYLNKSEITPDQIWAMRRYLPVVIPIGLLLAAGVLQTLWRRLSDPKQQTRHRGWQRTGQVGLAIAGVALALAPATSWRHTLRATQYGGDRELLTKLCDTVRGSDVIISDQGPGGTIFLPGLRVQCGVQAVLASEPTASALAAISANWRRTGPSKPVVVLAFLPSAAPWTSPPARPSLIGTATVWEEPLLHRPYVSNKQVVSVYVGDLAADGAVTPRAVP